MAPHGVGVALSPSAAHTRRVRPSKHVRAFGTHWRVTHEVPVHVSSLAHARSASLLPRASHSRTCPGSTQVEAPGAHTRRLQRLSAEQN